MKNNNNVDYLEEWLYPTSAILNVTDNCNLQCQYCFTEQHPNYMTLKTAKDIVHYLHNNLIKRRENNWPILAKNKSELYFFGGEPLLMYSSVIKPIIEYIDVVYPGDFSYGMTTNMTLLTPEIITFMSDHDFHLMASLDGIKDVQDYNRPAKNGSSSFDMAYKHIQLFLEKFPNVPYRSTLIPDNVEHLFKNYLWAEMVGFNTISILPNVREIWPKDKLIIMEEQLKQIFLYRLNQYLNGITPMNWGAITYLLQDIFTYDYDEEFYNSSFNITSYERCGLGTSSAIAIGYDGNIYSCQEYSTREEKNIFLIGNIYNGGIDINKHKKLLKTFKNFKIIPHFKEKECATCEFQDLCDDWVCLAENYDLYHEFKSQQLNSIECLWRKLSFKYILASMKILVEKDNDTFKKYLYRIYNLQKSEMEQKKE